MCLARTRHLMMATWASFRDTEIFGFPPAAQLADISNAIHSSDPGSAPRPDKDVLYTAELMDARAALRINFVHEVLPITSSHSRCKPPARAAA